QFPQVSGLTFRVDRDGPPGDRVRDVRVGGKPLDLDRTYTIAIPDFVLLGGDGYGMFADQQVLISPQTGELMSTALEKYTAAKGEITAQAESRILVQE